MAVEWSVLLIQNFVMERIEQYSIDTVNAVVDPLMIDNNFR
jgi:hypothetical protein